MTQTKDEIISELKNQLNNRFDALERYALDLKESLSSELKSTAGDKHDTSRAMIHLEQEKIQHKFSEIQLQLNQLKRIREVGNKETIGFGSLISTSNELFLIGIGLGKQIINGRIIYCVGMESPIGKLLQGKCLNEHFIFNGINQEIKAIH